MAVNSDTKHFEKVNQERRSPNILDRETGASLMVPPRVRSVTATVAAPLISVLMPAYNASATIDQAIESVLAQTEGDFEMLLVDDGSMDNTSRQIRQWEERNSRVKGITIRNSGVGAALNAAIEIARGKYLARMDADDVAVSGRFAAQAAFLDANPSISVLGGFHREFGDVKTNKTVKLPLTPDDIAAAALFVNPMSHPTTMFRRADMIKHHWRYSTTRRFPEDYDLWVRIVESGGLLANLPKVLVNYRVRRDSESHRPWPELRRYTSLIQSKLLRRLGITSSGTTMIHEAISFNDITPTNAFQLTAALKHLSRIYKQNQRCRFFNSESLAATLLQKVSELSVLH